MQVCMMLTGRLRGDAGKQCSMTLAYIIDVMRHMAVCREFAVYYVLC